jgi:hypothetical protein
MHETFKDYPNLQGEPWTSALKGHDLDPSTQQQESQRLMLERFQAEVRERTKRCY